ncbi:MAG TPA: hypothetical protein VGM62_06770 [Chthoniobacterales bacterium]
MTRNALIAAIATVAFIWPKFGWAQSQDEKPIIDTLNAAYEAESAADFNRFVSLVHPKTQRLFRDILSARTDILLKSYAQADISTVSGLPGHPKDLSLTDSALFVFTCYYTKLRHPEAFKVDAKRLPLTLEATTFDPDQLAHVVLTWPGAVHTERTNFSFIGSSHIFLRHEQSQWLIWTCPFATAIADSWCRDLAKGRIAQQDLR